MSAWHDGIMTNVLQLVEYRCRTGAELDAVWAANEEGVLELGEVLAQACATYSVSLPFRDHHLGAVLERDAQAATPAERGVVVQLADGRLGLTAGRGCVIESAGPYLVLITEPELGRYVKAWRIPGVNYWRNK